MVVFQSNDIHRRNTHFWFWVSINLAREGYWHALKDFVVFELLVEWWCHACRVFIMLHIIIWFFHWRTLQAEFNLTDESLLEAGHFVFLQAIKIGERDLEGGAEAGLPHRLCMIMWQKSAFKSADCSQIKFTNVQTLVHLSSVSNYQLSANSLTLPSNPSNPSPYFLHQCSSVESGGTSAELHALMTNHA